VDREGWSVRSIIGTAGIPGHFVNTIGESAYTTPNTSLWMNVNALQTLIQNRFARLPRFHRDWQWDLSRDGTTLDFRLTDTEIHSDNPFMNGIIDCDIDHEIDAGLPFFQWTSTLSGNFVIQPGVSRDMGWTAFLIVLNSRLAGLDLVSSEIMEEFNDTGAVTPQKKPVTPSYIPKRIRLKENITSRKSSFTFEYMLLCPIEKIMAASGLFQPIPGDWVAWTATMPATQFTGRGTAGLAASGVNNIVTVCTWPTSPSNNGTVNGVAENFALRKIFSTQCPPPENSWMDYKLWFEVVNDPQAIIHKPSYKVEPAQYQTSAAINLRDHPGYYNPTSAAEENVIGSQAADKQPVYQALSGYDQYVIMHGYAIRACYDIPIPSLEKYGDSDKLFVAGPVWDEQRILGGSGPVVFYGRRWRIPYIVPKGIGGGNATVNTKTSGVPAHYLNDKAMGPIVTTTP